MHRSHSDGNAHKRIDRTQLDCDRIDTINVNFRDERIAATSINAVVLIAICLDCPVDYVDMQSIAT